MNHFSVAKSPFFRGAIVAHGPRLVYAPLGGAGISCPVHDRVLASGLRIKDRGAEMKIVVGFVKTDEGRAAIEWATEEARRRQDAEIIVVHSMQHGSGTEAEAEEVSAYREQLEEVERRLSYAGIPHAIHMFQRGWSPAEDLIKVASDEGAEMIVIGLRRRSRTAKLFLGSNAQEILLDATCPVVAVKPKH